MSDGVGNGSAPETLAQQVSALRQEVARVAAETDANRWQQGSLEGRWSEQLTKLISIDGHASAARKAAGDAAHHAAEVGRQLAEFKTQVMLELQEIKSGVQVLVERKSVKRGRKG